jgi:hypothetical protein
MKTSLLFGALWVAAEAAHGQVYAAPGMPVQLHRRKPVEETRTRKPVMATPITSPIFTRFWHKQQAERAAAAAPYYSFQNQQMKYPVTSLRSGIGGKITARLVVLPDGRVGKVTILRRELDEHAEGYNSATPDAEAALEAEVVRVLSQVRFEPAATAIDTVRVVQSFKIE